MNNLNFFMKKMYKITKNGTLSILEKSIAIGFILSVLINFAGFSRQCEGINEKIIRFHIIANSDSERDQKLKLAIRDKILQATPDYFKISKNIDETAENLNSNLENLTKIAKDEINSQGFDYPVKAEICNMYFQPRKYDKIMLPGGNYRALRITIGSGKGKNWWCVIFPPMCLPAAEETAEIENVLDDKESEIVENEHKYEVKFKILDIFNRIKNWFLDVFKF